MANELRLHLPNSETGLTIVAKLYLNGIQQGSDVPCSEVSGAVYIGNMPSLPLGIYTVKFYEGSNLKGQGAITWDGIKEVTFNELGAKLNTLIQYNEADVILDENTNTLTLYEKGTQNVLLSFNTKNKDGIASDTDIYELENAG